MADHVVYFAEGRVLMGKPYEKRPVRTPKHGQKDNIKIECRGMGCGGYGAWPHGVG